MATPVNSKTFFKERVLEEESPAEVVSKRKRPLFETEETNATEEKTLSAARSIVVPQVPRHIEKRRKLFTSHEDRDIP